MNRRTFVSHLSAGLALQYVPASVLASSSSLSPPNPKSASWLDKAAELIENGALGIPQRLTILRVYSPERTSQATLLAMARQDLDLASRLLRTNLSIDPNTLFSDSPSSGFGSYSTCIHCAGMVLTWQGLARIGGRSVEPTSALHLRGSNSVLTMEMSKSSYKLVDFQGKTVAASNYVTGPRKALNVLS